VARRLDTCAKGRGTNDHGEILEVPAMPAWVEALNIILKKLGQDGKLTIITTAVAVFPQELR